MSLPRRAYPCGQCPIRADNCDKPEAQFPAERWQALSCTVRDPVTRREPTFTDPLFGCHKGQPGTDNDLTCAGWLAVFGADHLAVRLAVAHGRLPMSALEPGTDWPLLHRTWHDVVQAHTAPEEPRMERGHTLHRHADGDRNDRTEHHIVSTEVTVELGRWAADVDTYAAKHSLSREGAVLALVRDALTSPVRNSISGTVTGTMIQANDIDGGVHF